MLNLSLIGSSQKEYIMECSVFLLLQVEETWMKQYVKNDISALSSVWSSRNWRSFWTPIVLNQNKSSFLAPFFFGFNLSSFTSAPLPTLGQQRFWVDVLHPEIYNILWENTVLRISEKPRKILVFFWAEYAVLKSYLI